MATHMVHLVPAADLLHPARHPSVVTALCARLLRMFDPYRPERYYMRGPGPRWHAKHNGQAQAAPSAEA